ncbi:MAG: flippase-like domain-containing protein [Gammaproteobacteria bacterium]|nr:flippase-like domain-containing protein [Gammaproteobacteria bacterium]
MQLINKSGVIRIALIAAVLLSLFLIIPTISKNLDLRPLFQSDNSHFIVITALIVFFHFFLEPLRWYLYTRIRSPESSTNNVSFATVLSVLSTTALMSYTMPFKLGLPTRIYLIKVYFGMGVNRIIYYLGIDGFSNLIIWGVFGVVSAAYLLPLKQLSEHVLLVLAAGSIVVVFAYLGRNLIRKAIQPLLSGEYEITPKTIILSVTLIITDVIGFGLRHIAIFLFLDIPITLVDAFLIGILSVFAGIASTLPMGLGAYDATLIFLLTSRGIPIELASLAPILNRSLNLLSAMIFGGTSSVFLLKSPQVSQDSH